MRTRKVYKTVKISPRICSYFLKLYYGAISFSSLLYTFSFGVVGFGTSTIQFGVVKFGVVGFGVVGFGTIEFNKIKYNLNTIKLLNDDFKVESNFKLIFYRIPQFW